MNDTTHPPDEPDGPVAADDQARLPADPPSGAGGPQSAPPGAAAAAKGGESNGAESKGAQSNGAESNGAAAAAPTPPGGSPRLSPGPSARTPPAGQPAVGATSSLGGVPTRAATASPPNPGTAPKGPSASAEADPADGPTAQLRLPTAANGAGPQAVPTTPVVHRGPTPAAVPMPGPAAAVPPPWNRVPGQEAASVLVENRPTETFEDSDGPTAFLEPPSTPPPDGRKTGRMAGIAPPSRSGRSRPPRQASLQLKRLDPWSVLKLALVLAIVLFLIWLVAVGVLYAVLDGIGVWDRLNGTYADLVSGEAPTGSPLISAGRVFGLAAVVGAINSLLFAVAVTVGAFVYNVSADLVGGIEVTLSERD